MINFTESQLKAALIELRKTDDMKAYQLCFDLLESKMNEDDFADWLDDNGFVFEVAYVRCMQRKF